MNVMEVKAGEKIYHVSWEHPWKEMDFRGEKKTIKVTNCAIGEYLGTTVRLDGVEVPRYKWVGQGCLKWPIECTEPNCEHPGRHSRLLLPGERLNRDKARRLALTRALEVAAFRKTVRTLFWEKYFSMFNKAVNTTSGPTPPTQLPMQVGVPVPPPVKVAQGVINKMVSPMRFLAPASNYIH